MLKGLFRLEHLEQEAAVGPPTIHRVCMHFMGLKGRPCVLLRTQVKARKQVLGGVCKTRPGFPRYGVVLPSPLPLSFVFSLKSTLFLKSFPPTPICTLKKKKIVYIFSLFFCILLFCASFSTLASKYHKKWRSKSVTNLLSSLSLISGIGSSSQNSWLILWVAFWGYLP